MTPRISTPNPGISQEYPRMWPHCVLPMYRFFPLLDTFGYPQGYLFIKFHIMALLVGHRYGPIRGPSITLVYSKSKHLWFNSDQMQPDVRNAARISENSAWMMSTSKQFKVHQLQETILSLCRQQGCNWWWWWGAPLQPPLPPWRGMALAGEWRHHRSGLRHCAVQGTAGR